MAALVTASQVVTAVNGIFPRRGAVALPFAEMLEHWARVVCVDRWFSFRMSVLYLSMTQRFIQDVLRNTCNRRIIESLDRLELNDCWLVAGCLFQTVWNVVQGSEPESSIKDYDIFYFDAHDLSKEGEAAHQQRVSAFFAELGVNIEVKNQARVHTWYENYFGFAYPALASSKNGIDRFLILETCVGFSNNAGSLDVYAPHGVETIYSGILSPNPLTNHTTLYDEKCNSYQQRWPWLRRADSVGGMQ